MPKLGFVPSERNAWCDCIRGYAILLVCIAHMLYLEPVHGWFPAITTFVKGDTGVYMFYVLSGFLVTGILVREVERNAAPDARLRAIGRFFLRRIFRLQPSYILFLVFYGTFAQRHQEHPLSWFVLLIPMSNWFGGPYITWHIKTLHVEETYYVIIGLAAAAMRRSIRPLLLGLLIVAPLGRVALFVAGKLGGQVSFWVLDHYLPIEAFAVGGLLAQYWPGRLEKTRIVGAVTAHPAVSFVSALTALIAIAALRDVKPFSYVLLFTWPLIFSVCSAIMIVSGLRNGDFVFGGESIRRLGVVSYTVYLFQQFICGPWYETFGTPFSWLGWCAMTGGTLVLLPLWYSWVERPLTDLGARWFPRSQRVPAALDFSDERSKRGTSAPAH